MPVALVLGVDLKLTRTRNKFKILGTKLLFLQKEKRRIIIKEKRRIAKEKRRIARKKGRIAEEKRSTAKEKKSTVKEKRSTARNKRFGGLTVRRRMPNL